jgi:hypothetical protein
MKLSRVSFPALAWRAVVVHTVTYFVIGVIAFFALNYTERFVDPATAGYMRPTSHRLVMAGPLFQPIRGLLFAVVFYLLRDVFFARKRGWIVMWVVLVVLGIVSPFGPSPSSIEGMIYTTWPLWFHIAGMWETLLQSLMLSYLLFRWVNSPGKWLPRILLVIFVLVLAMSAMGLAVSR